MNRTVPARSPGLEDADFPKRWKQVRLGQIWIDALHFDGVLSAIDDLIRAGEGGSVFTPNVDHIMLAERDAEFRAAYQRASLIIPDGMPVVWASRLLRTPLPEKVSGSDLLLPLIWLAVRKRWRVYLVGGAPGTAKDAAALLAAQTGVQIVGFDAPVVSVTGECQDEVAILERIRLASPNLILVAFGAPKQELWISRVRSHLGAAVAVGIGAGLDFVTGRVRRSPHWMSSVGLEWLFRLAREPRRLWRRYLLRDPAFVLIVARGLASSRTLRVRIPPRTKEIAAPVSAGVGGPRVSSTPCVPT